MSETVAIPQGLPSHVKPGSVIAGKYRLEQEIGRGSMGTVYRAVHVTLGQRVAIKLIAFEHSQSAEARRRFSVEAKAAAKLRSRHVVQVYDDGETPEGNPYIVLEYLEGETLGQRLEREHDIPLADAVRIVTHVGRALARAHAEGIVHRDLKPANIFLVKAEDEEAGFIAKVLDFGIAKLEHGEKGTTQAGTVLGTPSFMSPEQVRGASSVDHRADLYSLGMCLFCMVSGELAYYSPNFSDVLVGICTLPLPKLRERAPWVPEAVEYWFQRACAKEPLERFQSADEMTEALRAAAGGVPLSKHESVPEGRIAPETLMGHAAPALATLRLEQSPLGLARTQPVVAPRPGAAPLSGSSASAPSPATVAIAIPSARREVTGDFALPKRSLAPLLIGVGIGLVTVAALFLAGSLFGNKGAPPSPSTLPGSAAVRPPPARIVSAPSVEAAAAISGAEPPRSPPETVDPVPTEAPRTSPAPAALGATKRERKPGALPATPAKAAAAGAGAPKEGGSDLGF